MKTEHTFKKATIAEEATSYINKTPGNKGNVIAFRDGCRVYLRGEYTSERTIKLLAEVVEALEV